MPTNPLLMSEKIGNGKFKYHMLGIVLQGDDKDEDKAKKECDAIVGDISKQLEKGKEVAPQYFRYEGLKLKVNAQTKEDADMAAANVCVTRLMKGEPITGKAKKAAK